MLKLLGVISAINTPILRLGRQLAWIALAIMVSVILLQVVSRYALGNALSWPDEAARFLMLWMTALMAPSGFRWGGFVAIDTFPNMMPRAVAATLNIVLLVLALVVLVTAAGHGYSHTMGFGGTFDSASLKIPLDWFGGESVKVKLRYMYGSLLLCVILLIMVNVELILRGLVAMLDPAAELPDDDSSFDAVEAE